MVTRLPAPTPDAQALIDAVIAERQNGVHATFFNLIHQEWKIRVEQYGSESGDPTILTPWTAVTGRTKTLQNLYLCAKAGDAQKAILDGLRDRTLQICPSCGENGNPGTLDHYLPKTVYPEFAILPLNLVPMCDTCQGAKKAKTITEQNLRMFLHPYFDEFADLQLVTLTIVAPFTSPTCVLTPSLQLPPDQEALVARHLHELRINERCTHQFRNQYRRMLRRVESVQSADIEAALRHFARMANLLSINSWEHVFYDGVLTNADLMEFLRGKVFPPLL